MSMKTDRDCPRIFAAWRLCDLALGSGTCRGPDQKAPRPRNGPTGKPVVRRRSGHEAKNRPTPRRNGQDRKRTLVSGLSKTEFILLGGFAAWRLGVPFQSLCQTVDHPV